MTHVSTQDMIMNLGLNVRLTLRDDTTVMGRVAAVESEQVHLSKSLPPNHPPVPLHHVKSVDTYPFE